MVLPVRLTCAVLVAICGAVLCGCLPPGQSQQEEEREPHFLTGRSRVNQMDYKGAIEAFSKALEVNPRSAAAHLELGWLYAEKDPDPSAAIYHYKQYLKLRPKAENAGTIQQHILGLQQELAKAVLPMPSTPGIQHEFERLAEENRQLRDEVEKWRTHYRASNTNPVIAVALPTPAGKRMPNPVAPTPLPRNEGQQNLGSTGRAATGVSSILRTHKVQARESPFSIARKYGVKVEALLAANPGLNPKRLQIGQTLNVPSP